MQIQANHASTAAAQQIARSVEMLNQLNQTIVDTSQDMAGKLIKVAVTDKIAENEKAGKLDLLA